MFSYFIIALQIGLIVLAVAVSISDYKIRKIPNKYLLSALIFALLVFAVMFFFFPFKQVAMGLLRGLMGFLVGCFLLLPAYFIRQVAAGDVKLLMVFGFILGPKGVVLALLNGAIIGGIWALSIAWQQGGLGNVFYNIKFMARSAYLTGFKEMGWDLRNEKAIKMPYGVALSIGAALVAIWQIYIHVGKVYDILGLGA